MSGSCIGSIAKVDPEVASTTPPAGQVTKAVAGAAATLTVNATAGSPYRSLTAPVQANAEGGALISAIEKTVVAVALGLLPGALLTIVGGEKTLAQFAGFQAIAPRTIPFGSLSNVLLAAIVNDRPCVNCGVVASGGV